MGKPAKVSRVPLVEHVERRILLIRGEKVMIADFMFRLTEAEAANLRSQFATSSSQRGHGGRRYLPLVFTEHGVAMLSSVLRSERAIQVNIAIMRAFVRLRELLATHKELARKLHELERKYDKQFAVVFVAIRKLMAGIEMPGRRIGF